MCICLCILYNVQCIVYIVYFIMYSVYCIMSSVYVKCIVVAQKPNILHVSIRYISV